MTYGGFWQIPDWNLENVLGFFWDMAKAAVPAGVAWVAYKVSVEAKEATQAQRDIASNQYKISLYEVRRDALLRLDKWLLSNKDYERDDTDQYPEIVIIIYNINNVFTVDFDFDEINNLIEIINEVDEYLIIMEDDSFSSMDSFERLDSDFLGKMTGIKFRLTREHRELCVILKRIADDCREQLRVPASPY